MSNQYCKPKIINLSTSSMEIYKYRIITERIRAANSYVRFEIDRVRPLCSRRFVSHNTNSWDRDTVSHSKGTKGRTALFDPFADRELAVLDTPGFSSYNLWMLYRSSNILSLIIKIYCVSKEIDFYVIYLRFRLVEWLEVAWFIDGYFVSR